MPHYSQKPPSSTSFECVAKEEENTNSEEYTCGNRDSTITHFSIEQTATANNHGTISEVIDSIDLLRKEVSIISESTE